MNNDHTSERHLQSNELALSQPRDSASSKTINNDPTVFKAQDGPRPGPIAHEQQHLSFNELRYSSKPQYNHTISTSAGMTTTTTTNAPETFTDSSTNGTTSYSNSLADEKNIKNGNGKAFRNGSRDSGHSLPSPKWNSRVPSPRSSPSPTIEPLTRGETPPSELAPYHPPPSHYTSTSYPHPIPPPPTKPPKISNDHQRSPSLAQKTFQCARCSQTKPLTEQAYYGPNSRESKPGDPTGLCIPCYDHKARLQRDQHTKPVSDPPIDQSHQHQQTAWKSYEPSTPVAPPLFAPTNVSKRNSSLAPSAPSAPSAPPPLIPSPLPLAKHEDTKDVKEGETFRCRECRVIKPISEAQPLLRGSVYGNVGEPSNSCKTCWPKRIAYQQEYNRRKRSGLTGQGHVSTGVTAAGPGPIRSTSTSSVGGTGHHGYQPYPTSGTASPGLTGQKAYNTRDKERPSYNTSPSDEEQPTPFGGVSSTSTHTPHGAYSKPNGSPGKDKEKDSGGPTVVDGKFLCRDCKQWRFIEDAAPLGKTSRWGKKGEPSRTCKMCRGAEGEGTASGVAGFSTPVHRQTPAREKSDEVKMDIDSPGPRGGKVGTPRESIGTAKSRPGHSKLKQNTHLPLQTSSQITQPLNQYVEVPKPAERRTRVVLFDTDTKRRRPGWEDEKARLVALVEFFFRIKIGEESVRVCSVGSGTGIEVYGTEEVTGLVEKLDKDALQKYDSEQGLMFAILGRSNV